MNRNINNLRIVMLVFFLILVSWPLEVLAHQPRLVEMEKINITKPIAKAVLITKVFLSSIAALTSFAFSLTAK